ncbi:hypothetical protein CLIB1444_17S01178 [[Candida] jaroonii]|uniref:Uncharacterized protein n=1 Tax=[Candida] jaroonii TaxID=467808 RepID=A0ACA9YEW1_9ASCO|nr:hypothetical protein CLIB1444_17S01178 [[Candida] jaroonii]
MISDQIFTSVVISMRRYLCWELYKCWFSVPFTTLNYREYSDMDGLNSRYSQFTLFNWTGQFILFGQLLLINFNYLFQLLQMYSAMALMEAELWVLIHLCRLKHEIDVIWLFMSLQCYLLYSTLKPM